MRRTALFAAAMALLLAAAPAAAQRGTGQGPPRPEMMEEEERRPFELLVQARRELELTDAQVARLEEIARGLEERNRPLRGRLREQWERWRAEQRAEIEAELRRLPPEERQEALRRMMAERRRQGLPAPMRPIAGEMMRNIRGARQQAQRVLTPRQKQRARALLEEHQSRRRRPRPIQDDPRQQGGRPPLPHGRP